MGRGPESYSCTYCSNLSYLLTHYPVLKCKVHSFLNLFKWYFWVPKLILKTHVNVYNDVHHSTVTVFNCSKEILCIPIKKIFVSWQAPQAQQPHPPSDNKIYRSTKTAITYSNTPPDTWKSIRRPSTGVSDPAIRPRPPSHRLQGSGRGSTCP